jgi:hypothetical protein
LFGVWSDEYPDHDTLLCAVVDARSEHVGFGSRDSARALERLRAVLDRAELIHALNRMNRKPIQGRLQAGLSVGYGLTGFLVAWLSRHHFLRAIPIAILIRGLIAAGDALQLYSKIPSASATILQGLLFVAALGASGLAGRRCARHG